jgi:ABC transporter transmembrane region 2
MMLAITFVILRTYQICLQQWLLIRWRQWMTKQYLERWISDANHYRMQLLGDAADNPDQRISEDIKSFIDLTLYICIEVLSSAVSFFSFGSRRIFVARRLRSTTMISIGHRTTALNAFHRRHLALVRVGEQHRLRESPLKEATQQGNHASNRGARGREIVVSAGAPLKRNERRLVLSRRPPERADEVAYFRFASVRSDDSLTRKVWLHQLEPMPPGLMAVTKVAGPEAVWSLVKALQSPLFKPLQV